MSKEEPISARQLFTLTIMAQLGIEVLSLPHIASEKAGHDTWLAVLISGAAAQAGILLLWWLGSRFPNRNIYAYSRAVIGRPLGATLNMLYGCYYAYSGLVLTALYTDILKRWIFMMTPRWLIFLMLLIVSGNAAVSSLKRLAFISQTFLIFPVICFLLIACSGIYGLEPKHLLPVISNGWGPIMTGAYASFSAYLGYDLLLYAYPYVQTSSKKKVLIAMLAANACAIVFYVTVCLVCTTMFGPKQLLIVPEPIVFILKNYRIQILQSLDYLFLVIYVCVVTATIYVYFFLASKAFQHVRTAGLGKQAFWVWAIVGVGFAGSLFLTRRGDILRMASIQDQLAIVMVIVLPLLLLLIAGMRRIGRSQL
ncbi:GerAB/ArcD/ProY family transporter [Paenibacillus xanthanilyticus]|uniref:GerAB/ArcD/ProY family transporter n=1 Tax=Paenibacillus xanthanilyticus TaxID=1783531 RepID=A0ABV8K6I4_9BACL